MVYTLEDLKKSEVKKTCRTSCKGTYEHQYLRDETDALAEMTRKAIETLSKNKKGFVLMVEGSMIDWGAHEQNIEYVVSEMIDLDNAIGVAWILLQGTERHLLLSRQIMKQAVFHLQAETSQNIQLK